MRPSGWIGLLAFVVGASSFACSSSSDSASGGDGGGGADGGGGDGGVTCCPPDPSPGCCMHPGGAATGGTCVEICDGMPVPSDPGWKLVNDSSGCPTWTNASSSGTNFCGAPQPVVDSGVDASDASDDTDAHDD